MNVDDKKNCHRNEENDTRKTAIFSDGQVLSIDKAFKGETASLVCINCEWLCQDLVQEGHKTT